MTAGLSSEQKSKHDQHYDAKIKLTSWHMADVWRKPESYRASTSPLTNRPNWINSFTAHKIGEVIVSKD